MSQSHDDKIAEIGLYEKYQEIIDHALSDLSDIEKIEVNKIFARIRCLKVKIMQDEEATRNLRLEKASFIGCLSGLCVSFFLTLIDIDPIIPLPEALRHMSGQTFMMLSFLLLIVISMINYHEKKLRQELKLGFDEFWMLTDFQVNKKIPFTDQFGLKNPENTIMVIKHLKWMIRGGFIQKDWWI